MDKMGINLHITKIIPTVHKNCKDNLVISDGKGVRKKLKFYGIILSFKRLLKFWTFYHLITYLIVSSMIWKILIIWGSLIWGWFYLEFSVEVRFVPNLAQWEVPPLGTQRL